MNTQIKTEKSIQLDKDVIIMTKNDEAGKRNLEISEIELNPIEGFEAFRLFINTLQPKNGSREIWLKEGHEIFYKAYWDESGIFPIYQTSGTGEARKLTGKSWKNGYEYLRDRTEKSDDGAFYIPTQPEGLPIEKYVSCTDRIVIEFDTDSRDEQIKKVRNFARITGLRPIAILSSGGKSLHIHFTLDQHLPIIQAQNIRRLSVVGLMSDFRLVGLHQPARIPGFFRKEKGNEQELLYVSDCRYSESELLEGLKKWYAHIDLKFPEDGISDSWWKLFNKQKRIDNKTTRPLNEEECRELLSEGFQATSKPNKAVSKTPTKTSSYKFEKFKYANITYPWGNLAENFTIPVELILSNQSKEILKGIGEGSRDNSGASLARDLIGCENLLLGYGFEVQTTARELFDNFCEACDPPIGTGKEDNPSDPDRIWRSAENNNPSPSRYDEYILIGTIWKEVKHQIGIDVFKRQNWLKGLVGFSGVTEESINNHPESLENTKNYLALFADYSEINEILAEYPEIISSDTAESSGRKKKPSSIDKVKSAVESIARTELGKIKNLLERGEISYLQASTLYPGYIFQQVFAEVDPIKFDKCRLLNKFGYRLKFNGFRMLPELDGKEFIPEHIEVGLNHHNFEFQSKGDDRRDAIFCYASKNNPYEPIGDYLFSCPTSHGEILNGLANRLFGCGDEPMYDVYLKKWLLSAVARALIPGCKADVALICQGAQGLLKSTFGRILAGGVEYFCDTFERDFTKDKDSLEKVVTHWICELPEIDGTFKRSEIEEIKAFLAHPTEKFRPPYGKTRGTFPRRSVFYGTANGCEFLNDPTGSRRFWIIPVKKSFDDKWLRENRDFIWGAALKLFLEIYPDWESRGVGTYKEEYLWWLAPIEEAWRIQDNKNYENRDPWEDSIIKYMGIKQFATSDEIARIALQLDSKSLNGLATTRITTVLKQNGYALNPHTRDGRSTIDGIKARFWRDSWD